MATLLLPAGANNIVNAARLLLAGELVAFPTETVYGLGANAQNPNAVAAIFTAKGRPNTNPIIVHVANKEAAQELVSAWPAIADALATAFWPGPLTLVLRKSDRVPDVITAGGDTVAVRMPAHPIALRLLQEAGVPIAAPSANRSGELSPTTAEHVLASLNDRIPMILDGGPCPGGLESTVLDLCSNPPRLLRPGLITKVQLERIVGPILIGGSSETVARSPGMLVKHYSPRTRLVLVAPHQDFTEVLNQLERTGLRVTEYQLAPDAVIASSRLYADLHELDAAGWDRILVRLPPDDDTWRALRDRLSRAAAQ